MLTLPEKKISEAAADFRPTQCDTWWWFAHPIPLNVTNEANFQNSILKIKRSIIPPPLSPGTLIWGAEGGGGRGGGEFSACLTKTCFEKAV